MESGNLLLGKLCGVGIQGGRGSDTALARRMLPSINDGHKSTAATCPCSIMQRSEAAPGKQIPLSKLRGRPQWSRERCYRRG